jgi:hypothetical protein
MNIFGIVIKTRKRYDAERAAVAMVFAEEKTELEEELERTGQELIAKIQAVKDDCSTAMVRQRNEMNAAFTEMYNDNKTFIGRRHADKLLIDALVATVKKCKHEIKNAEYSQLLEAVNANAKLKDV